MNYYLFIILSATVLTWFAQSMGVMAWLGTYALRERSREAVAKNRQIHIVIWDALFKLTICKKCLSFWIALSIVMSGGITMYEALTVMGTSVVNNILSRYE